MKTQAGIFKPTNSLRKSRFGNEKPAKKKKKQEEESISSMNESKLRMSPGKRSINKSKNKKKSKHNNSSTQNSSHHMNKSDSKTSLYKSSPPPAVNEYSIKVDKPKAQMFQRYLGAGNNRLKKPLGMQPMGLLTSSLFKSPSNLLRSHKRRKSFLGTLEESDDDDEDDELANLKPGTGMTAERLSTKFFGPKKTLASKDKFDSTEGGGADDEDSSILKSFMTPQKNPIERRVVKYVDPKEEKKAANKPKRRLSVLGRENKGLASLSNFSMNKYLKRKRKLDSTKTLDPKQMLNLMERAMFLDNEIRQDVVNAFCSSNGINQLLTYIMKPKSIQLGKLVILERYNSDLDGMRRYF